MAMSAAGVHGIFEQELNVDRHYLRQKKR